MGNTLLGYQNFNTGLQLARRQRRVGKCARESRQGNDGASVITSLSGIKDGQSFQVDFALAMALQPKVILKVGKVNFTCIGAYL